MKLADKFGIGNGGQSLAPDSVAHRSGVFGGGRGPIVLMYHSVEKGGGTPDWRWAVSLQRFVEQMDYLADAGWSPVPLAALDNPEIRNASRQFTITFDDAYEDNLPAYEALAERGWPATWFVVSSAIGGLSTWRDPGVPRRPTMLPNHLREMRTNGMEIGGHSRSHRALADAPVSELAVETVGCRKALEDVLGGSVESFAYPYGSYSRAVIEAVRDAGYRRACSTDNGTAWQDNDPFRLRRIAVLADDTRSAFARKLILLDDDSGLKGAARSAIRFGRRVTGIDRRLPQKPRNGEVGERQEVSRQR
jgi:peptidoglycan/xylan/chitin deacetylase (PgdA/CDA1 family)